MKMTSDIPDGVRVVKDLRYGCDRKRQALGLYLPAGSGPWPRSPVCGRPQGARPDTFRQSLHLFPHPCRNIDDSLAIVRGFIHRQRYADWSMSSCATGRACGTRTLSGNKTGVWITGGDSP